MLCRSLDGAWETETYSRVCGGCHVSTFSGRGVTYFFTRDLMAFEIQFEAYIMDMWDSEEFSGLKEISELAKRMVERKKKAIFISFFTCDIIFDFASCHYYCREVIFSHEHCEESIEESEERSMGEW